MTDMREIRQRAAAWSASDAEVFTAAEVNVLIDEIERQRSEITGIADAIATARAGQRAADLGALRKRLRQMHSTRATDVMRGVIALLEALPLTSTLSAPAAAAPEPACEVCGDLLLTRQPTLCERCVNTDEADDLRHTPKRGGSRHG